MAIKASKKKKPASASKSSKKSSKSSKKKVAVKIATKKAVRKVTSKVKATIAASKKAASKTKSTKVAKSTKSTKAKAAKGTVTRVHKAATGRASKSKQAKVAEVAEVVILPTATTVAGRTQRVFKVLAQRGENLESIFSQGLLRGRFSTEAFTIAPKGLPFTAFSNRQDAQRFVDRSNVNRKDDWAEWIIAEGEGVIANNHPQRRHPQIHSFNPQNSKELQAAAREIKRVGGLPYQRRSRHSNRTVVIDNPNKRWSIGTVFVESFKILMPNVS